MINRVTCTCFSVCLLVVFSACRSTTPTPDIGAIYHVAAGSACFERDPVVVIPDIMGSRLYDDVSDTLVWGAFSGDWVDPRQEAGARLIGIPMEFGVKLGELRDWVRPDGALGSADISLMGLPTRLRVYAHIMAALAVGGYRDEAVSDTAVDYMTEHFTCFQFDYDWRRSNAENAAKLHAFLREKADYVKRESLRLGVSRENIRFNVVAHSMGGLIARYQLMYGDAQLPEDGSLPELTWAGSEYVKRLIMVGTPNGGSADAFLRLVEGFDTPGLPPYSAALVGTFPSVYELLPRTRHDPLIAAGDGRTLDIYDHNLWRDMGWGLADPEERDALAALLPYSFNDSSRSRTGLEHQRKCLRNARLFHAALDRQAPAPDDVHIDLVTGDAIPTVRSVEVDTTSGKVAILTNGPGDGTVLRTSALLDERGIEPGNHKPLDSPIDWESILFLPVGHREITRDPVFSDNILFQLLEVP